MEGGPAQGGKRLLVLGAGPAQLGLLAAARARGLFVIAVDRNPAAPGFRYADRRAILSAEDEPGIDRLADAERVDGIIAPGIDWPVAIAARVADRLGLPHPLTPAAAVLATSKLRQRERFAAAGVPQPAHAVCRTVEDAAAAADGIGYPCVVKPPDRQGQRGLSAVSEPAGLAEAVAAAFGAARNGIVLVEELVGGREITVNGFARQGRFHALTVTDRELAPPPAFGVALAHVWPSALPAPDVDAAIRAASAAGSALGISDGPTYTQVRFADDGPRVGELAARLGGGHDAELCQAALEVDLNGLAISAALGEEIPEAALEPARRTGGACVRFLVAPPGQLRAVAGVARAARRHGIVDVRVYYGEGHEFGPLRRGADRAGALIAVGADREQAVERADEAAALITFDTATTQAAVG